MISGFCRKYCGLQAAVYALSVVGMGVGGWLMGSGLQSEEKQIKNLYYTVGVSISVAGAISASLLNRYRRLTKLERDGLQPGQTKICEMGKAIIAPLIPGGIISGIAGFVAHECSQCVSG